MKKNKRILLYLGGAVIFLILFSVIGKKAGFIGGKEIIKVAVEKAAFRTIVETVSASGKIQPEAEVKISPDVSGEIVGLYVKEGDKVKKGDLLAKIKPDVYLSLVDRAIAALNSAKANLANAQSRSVQAASQYKKAQSSFDRSKKLYADKVISDADYEAAQSAFEVAKAETDAAKESVSGAKFNVASAEASVKEAKDNLNKTTIMAPVDGTIYGLKVELGERVVGTSQVSGTEMMRIANLGNMEVDVDVNENDIARLSVGDTANIEVDAYLNQKFVGIVTEIANSANSLGATVDQVTNFTVKIRILPESYKSLMKPGVASPFRPGLSATVDIMTERQLNVLTIPIQAVTVREDSTSEKKEENQGIAEQKQKDAKKETLKDKEYVFLFSEGSVKQVEVATGIQDDQYIIISKGLDKDAEVVIAPYLAISKRLKDGSLVEKVDKEKLFEGKEKGAKD